MIENKYNRDMYRSAKYKENSYGSSKYERISPSEKILALLKDVRGLSKSLRTILSPSSHPCNISTGHLKDGVRTNGLLRKSGGLSAILKELTDYRSALECTIKQARDREPATSEAIRIILEQYRICPSCEGRQGAQFGPNYWADCGECDGIGMIEVSKNE